MTDPQYTVLGPAADIPPGATRDFQVADRSILVANCDGAFHAIEDRCTHDDGPLAEGRMVECQVECPRHGARFDLESGRPTALPAVRPVAVFPCRVNEAGEIEVDLGAAPPPSRFGRRPQPGR
jgi:3-phenylpropionate/trans-cinnamate dioxygenase ferredoxin subunit